MPEELQKRKFSCSSVKQWKRHNTHQGYQKPCMLRSCSLPSISEVLHLRTHPNSGQYNDVDLLKNHIYFGPHSSILYCSEVNCTLYISLCKCNYATVLQAYLLTTTHHKTPSWQVMVHFEQRLKNIDKLICLMYGI